VLEAGQPRNGRTRRLVKYLTAAPRRI